MRVLAKFEIDCDADATWRALHSPAVLSELYGPLLRLTPLDDLPTQWAVEENEAGVALSIAGIPLGRQLIQVHDRTRVVDGEDVRILRDAGTPLTGPLAALDVWDHQIAVSDAGGGRTLWRERLTIGGKAAPALWPVLWGIWQWRTGRIKRLAPSWAHDPAPRPAEDEASA